MQRVCIFLLVTLAGCDSTPVGEGADAEWKAAYSPEECEALLSREAVIERCGNGSLEKALAVLSRNADKCLPYSAPKQFSGIWLNDLEASEFYPNIDDIDLVGNADAAVWLDVANKDEVEEALAAQQGAGDVAYRVRFSGRESSCDFGYGHMGAYSSEILLTRFSNIEKIAWPSK